MKEEKKHSIIVLSKDTLYNSLAQAIIKLFEKSSILLKSILFVFILSSVSLASIMVIESILNYFSYEVITTSRVIYETPTLFPKVTICNQNMFTSEYGYEFAKNTNSSWNVFTQKDMLRNMSYAESYQIRVNFYNLVMGNVFKSNLNDEDRKKMSHNFEDVLLSCYFNNQICNASDFRWKFDPLYGNCYEFNWDRKNIKYSTIPGWINGLILELYVNFNENLGEFNSVYGGMGAVIRIDNSSYLIDHGWDGVQVQAGTNSFVSLDRSFKFMLSKPYSNCEIDSETFEKHFKSDLFHLIVESQYVYTQMLCFEQCYQREAMRECGFADSNFLSLFPQKPVETNEEYTCVNDVYSYKYLSFEFLNKICLSLCPLECNRTEYRASLTSSQLMGDIYVDYIKGNQNLSKDFINKSINTDTASRSIVKINIFYPTLSYTQITESAKMNAVSLFASIGGNLGLFLGVSFFSVYEVIELILRIFYIKKEKKTLG